MVERMVGIVRGVGVGVKDRCMNAGVSALSLVRGGGVRVRGGASSCTASQDRPKICRVRPRTTLRPRPRNGPQCGPYKSRDRKPSHVPPLTPALSPEYEGEREKPSSEITLERNAFHIHGPAAPPVSICETCFTLFHSPLR